VIDVMMGPDDGIERRKQDGGGSQHLGHVWPLSWLQHLE